MINNDLYGYIKVDESIFTYSASDYVITLLSAKEDSKEQYADFLALKNYNMEEVQYLYGVSQKGRDVAMLCRRNITPKFMSGVPSAQFWTPLIIEAAGNGKGFYDNLTANWNMFHAVTFYGGNINPLYYPDVAMREQSIDELLHISNGDGSYQIKFRPYEEYTHNCDACIEEIKCTITTSVLHSSKNEDKRNIDAYNVRELESSIRISFDEAQDFSMLEKCYEVVKSLVALLTMQNNVTFNMFLSQRDQEGKFRKSAICKFYDGFENYSERNQHKVVSLNDVRKYLPSLIDVIIKDKLLKSLLVLLPNDNKNINHISLTNVQDLCTSLEIAYNKNKRTRVKDHCIEELKNSIKATIAEHMVSHGELDAYKKTTVSKAFEYMDYTLREKIITLCRENQEVINMVEENKSVPKINEDCIGNFVKLRNNITHSGIVDLGDNLQTYKYLYTLVYSYILKEAGMSFTDMEVALKNFLR